MKSVYLVLNPNAGTRQGRRFLTEIISAFNRADYLCGVFITEKRGDAVTFASEHGSETDLIVACGGDGTLNEVVTGLLISGHTTPLGYIPCGSTNDFANGLGLPAGVIDNLDNIIQGAALPLDIGLFGEKRYFCYTASFGLFTSVSWSTPQNVKNILGHAAYILEGIRSLSDVRPIHMKITADGQETEADYLFGAVCNSTSLGGVLKLEHSEVHMSDGLFEALLIPFPPDLIVLNQILAALRSHRYSDPCLTFIRASRFTFEGAPDLRWTLDGEEADGSERVVIRNLNNAVRLMTSARGE